MLNLITANPCLSNQSRQSMAKIERIANTCGVETAIYDYTCDTQYIHDKSNQQLSNPVEVEWCIEYNIESYISQGQTHSYKPTMYTYTPQARLYRQSLGRGQLLPAGANGYDNSIDKTDMKN